MSSFSTMEIINSSSSDSKHYMKQFINAVGEYVQTRAEDTANVITRNLQLISVTIDLSTFDPHTNVVAEFFVSLHELLSCLEPRSLLSWCCVNVLAVACRNSAARNTLIHTYQFLPLLSRLLGDQLIMEKKIRLLSLMQELTCGIKISWQIPHLPHLMSTLTRWVASGEEEIVTLSLGLLVNLCYKNLPAVYTLSRCVDIKTFIRTCMPLKGLKIEVHVCKLLIIIDYMNGKVPEEAFMKLIEVTFKSLTEAFKERDSILLRHVVEFFLDMWTQKIYTEALLNFNNYNSEVEELLQEVETTTINESGDSKIDQDPECVALLFEFLHFLIQLKQPKLMEQHARLVNVALKWIQNELVCTQALAILHTIAVDTTEEKCISLDSFLKGLPIFLLAIENGDEEIPTNIENNKRLSALMELLCALMKVKGTRECILEVVKEELLMKIFTPLLGVKLPRTRASNANTFSSEALVLYVNAIALIDELVKYDDRWNSLYTNLMRQKQIHMVLAQALYGGPKETKVIIMSMSSSYFFPKSEVAAAMCEVQSLMQVDARVTHNNNQDISDNLCFPMMSVTQIDKLNEIMDRLKDAFEQNNITNVSTSDVMELYEYKLATMTHAERAAIASVEAASQRCTHLQHRTAQLTAELSRLHQLLLHAQQCYEDAAKTRDSVLTKNKELQEWLEVEKNRYNSQLLSNEKLLNEKTQLLEETLKQLKETKQAKILIDEKYTELKQLIAKLEGNLLKKEKLVEKQEEELAKLNTSNEHIKVQIVQLERQVKQMDGELICRTRQLEEVSKELDNYKSLINTITQLTTSQNSK